MSTPADSPAAPLPAAIDPLYPSRHPRPPRDWVNDPNGLVRHGDRWHLFAQHDSAFTMTGDKSWWHAESTDLVSWTDCGVPLVPPYGDESRADRDGIWSGNAISHDGELVAFYSGFRTDAAWQPAMRAVSSDDGATFTAEGRVIATAPDVVVLPDGTRTTVHTLRDPFAWADPAPDASDAHRWSLVLGAGLDVLDRVAGEPERYAALLRFVSTDLATWTYAGVFHHLPVPAQGLPPTEPDTGEMWECPAYASLPAGDGTDVSALIVCGWYRTPFPARAIVLLADRSGDELRQRSAAFLEDGDALYAPSLLNAPDGRVLLWGWVQEQRDSASAAAVGWSGALTFPRDLTIRDGSLALWPVPELDAMRDRPLAVADSGFDLPINAEVLIDGSAGPVALTLSSGDTELTLELDPVAGRATVGSFVMVAEPTDPADPGAESWLRVFVDGSVVEAFTSAGRSATARVYPSDHAGWVARVDAGSAAGVRAWPLLADAGVHD